MSKLFDWLAIICAFLSIWLAILYNFIEFEIFNEYHSMISFVPVIAILSLGIYSVVTILWRVYNFNDCHKEAFELHAEIKEARADLITRGFVFQ
ncbi:hypothetical protein PGB90_009653 [Kerria lacca]